MGALLAARAGLFLPLASVSFGGQQIDNALVSRFAKEFTKKTKVQLDLTANAHRLRPSHRTRLCRPSLGLSSPRALSKSAATCPPPPSSALKTVGNYNLGRPIAEGTFGKVSLATHRLTNTRVAIKQIPKSHSSHAAAALTREIHHHRKLHHPHVTQLYEVLATDSSIWMVSKLCAGGELYDYLVERGTLPDAEARRLFGQLCLSVTTVMAIALSNSGGRAPDWPDFLGIVLLLLANATVGFVEERQAGRPSLLSRTGSPSTGKPSSSTPSSPRTRSSCSAYASRTENADAIDSCVVGTLNSPAEARAGIRVVDFQPFDPSTKRTQVSYVETETNKMYRVTKGMSPVILNLCTLNKTEEVSRRLEADVEEFAMRGLRAHQRRPLQASPKAPSKHLVTTASPRVPSKSSRIKSSMPRATPKTRTTRTSLGVDQALPTIVTATGPSSTCGSTTYLPLPLPLSSLGQPPSGTPSLGTARVAKG
ncbi:unnamed protein product [Tilletia controversa]|nr:unnamed protein product [Tilletia controversa]